MLMNFLSEMYQLISDGNISDPCFWMEKNKEAELGKKQGSYSKTSFSFFLKTTEKQSNYENEELRFYYYGMTAELSKYFLGYFLSTPLSIFSNFLLLGASGFQLASKEYRNRTKLTN